MNNIVFDEDTLYYSILVSSKQMLDILNKKESTNEVQEEIKKVNRIYGNVFALFLINEYKCTSIIENNKKHYKLDIEGESYICDEAILKSILFKNFDEVIEKALIK